MCLRLREPINGLSHLGAALAAVAGLVLLLDLARPFPERLSGLLVYGLTLVIMFASSAAYHLVDSSPAVIESLRKLDHSAIYLLIAGTYTPLCLHFFTGFWRTGILVIVWSLALIGVGIKLLVIRAPRGLTAGVYLGMGWLSVLGIGQILRTMPGGALFWLLVGGLFYTVGAGVYVAKRPNLAPGVFGFHELWHIFVILGALSHYLAIALYVAAAPGG